MILIENTVLSEACIHTYICAYHCFHFGLLILFGRSLYSSNTKICFFPPNPCPLLSIASFSCSTFVSLFHTVSSIGMSLSLPDLMYPKSSSIIACFSSGCLSDQTDTQKPWRWMSLKINRLAGMVRGWRAIAP